MTTQPNNDDTIQWYWVSAHYQSSIEATGEELLFEKIVFLVRAINDSDAMEKGLIVAKQKEHSYTNASNELLAWKFLKIEDVQLLFNVTISDGTEVY